MSTPTGSEPSSGTHSPFGVRCTRCGRTQPPDREPSMARWPYCVYCSGPLSMTRWVAAPPAGLGPAPKIRRIDLPYAGPPHYGAVHPTWGFPPVAKYRNGPGDQSGGNPFARSAASREAVRQLSDAALTRRLAAAVWLTIATAVACLAAAGAEGWRYALLLRGRTEILPGWPVRASDTAVLVASTAALLLAGCAALAGASALSALYQAAAQRQGVQPVRTPGDIAARLIVPGWNLYGAVQVVIEVAHLVFRSVDGIGRTQPRWMRALVRSGSATWVLGGLALAVMLGFSLARVGPWHFGSSEQFAANLVEAHIALDLLAAITAALFAAILVALRTEWFGARAGRRSKWVVAPPVSSARNRHTDEPAPRDTSSATPDLTVNESAEGTIRKAVGTPSAATRLPDARAHTGQHRRRK